MVLLCFYVADPATFLASNSVLGPDSLMGGEKKNISEFVHIDRGPLMKWQSKK